MSIKSTILYIVSTLFVVAFVVSLPSPAKAVSTTGIANKEARVEARATGTQTQLANIITRGDSMIADRLASLQNLLNRVSSDKRLSDTDKASLVSDINSTIAALNTLKTKIDADTDVTTVRADVKSIVTSYHIYMFYEPKERLLVVIDNLLTETNTISTLAGKVQSLVTDLKNQGKDVTTAQTALTDISAQLTAINTLLTTDKSLIVNITNATINPQSVFVQVRKDLATVRADFAKIRADFAALRQFFKINIPKGTVSLKPSPATSSAK